MGVRMIFLNYLEQKGIFQKGSRVLDIGAQNLYLANAGDVSNFITKYNPSFPQNELASFADQLEKGGTHIGCGFLNNSFLSDLLIAAGMEYLSMDIFERVNNLVVDLNYYNLDKNLKNKHDIVLNFGTTEHVFNQYNCFKVIHEATKPGGYIFHQVPSTGCVDHGYFVYSPYLFSNLARANDYEILDMWLSGPYSPDQKVFDTVKLEKEMLMKDDDRPDNNISEWSKHPIPDSVINVLFRKRKDDVFKLALDTSTTISANLIPESISSYQPSEATQDNKVSRWRKLFDFK